MRYVKLHTDHVFSCPSYPRHVDSDQAEVRSAALDAVGSCYVSLDMDPSRIHRLMGSVNDKTKTLVEEVNLALVSGLNPTVARLEMITYCGGVGVALRASRWAGVIYIYYAPKRVALKITYW